MTDLDAPATVRALRATFDSRRTRPLAWREQQLVAMRRMLVDNERAIAAALAEDLGKPRFETWAAEIEVTVREIDELRRNLRRWTGEERVRVPWVLRPGRAEIHREPLGVVLVIAPWNYPVHLLLTPMAAGIAAGNAVLGKPSELAPATSALMGRLAAAYLDTDAVRLVQGGVSRDHRAPPGAVRPHPLHRQRRRRPGRARGGCEASDPDHARARGQDAGDRRP